MSTMVLLALPFGILLLLVLVALVRSIRIVPAQTTLVVVPSLALLRQIRNEWAEQRKTVYDYLCVCSEADIDKAREKLGYIPKAGFEKGLDETAAWFKGNANVKPPEEAI